MGHHGRESTHQARSTPAPTCSQDAFHRTLVPGFDIALTVLATIISRTGDMVVHRRRAQGHRNRPHPGPRLSVIRARSGSSTGSTSSMRSTQRSSWCPARSSALGDRVELMPGYAPTTVNFYDFYYVVADDRVVGRLAHSCPLRQRHRRRRTAAARKRLMIRPVEGSTMARGNSDDGPAHTGAFVQHRISSSTRTPSRRAGCG